MYTGVSTVPSAMPAEHCQKTTEERSHVAAKLAPRGPALAAGDLTGFDARRADVEAVLVAAGARDDAHGLDVGIPSTARPAMGVRHRLAKAGALPADIADGSHT